MKRIVIPISCAFLLPLTGCLDESSSGGNRTIFKVDESARKTESSRYGYGSGETEDGRKATRTKPDESNPDQPEGQIPPQEIAAGDNSAVEGTDSPETTGSATETGASNTAMTENEKPKEKETSSGSTTPVAQMVPGKSGQVYSPFAPGKPVDVSGYPPGTLMRCPYTGKEFKVP